MRELILNCPLTEDTILDEQAVLKTLIENHKDAIPFINKVKFYEVPDEQTGLMLRFLIIWCDYDLRTRMVLFEEAEAFVNSTGWYPLVTGRRSLHHKRPLLDFTEKGLRKAMNKSRIETIPGLGTLVDFFDFSPNSGTSILLQTTEYDILLDCGLQSEKLDYQKLRTGSRKWLFISHCHKDHTGGIVPFLKNRQWLVSSSPITFELLLPRIADDGRIESIIPRDFFYRFAPMWFRSQYCFSDGSSIRTVSVNHFPGSIGYIFTFADGKRLFYSGDWSFEGAYFLGNEGGGQDRVPDRIADPVSVDFALLEGEYIGREIGGKEGGIGEIHEAVLSSLASGRNHLILAQPDDYGTFLFLFLYDQFVSRQENVSSKSLFFLDRSIIDQLEMIEWHLKRKHIGSLDDHLLKFMSRRAALAESVSVFDLQVRLRENIEEIKRTGLRGIFIADPKRLDDKSYLGSEILTELSSMGLDLSRLAKAATPEMPVYAGLNARRVTDFDGGIWMLHTHEMALAKYITERCNHLGSVYLFHNFKKRIERFANKMRNSGYNGEINAVSNSGNVSTRNRENGSLQPKDVIR